LPARGLDIDGLPHVVNFELPTTPQDYIHRIGRTGRAGMEGDAVSLVCIDERTCSRTSNDFCAGRSRGRPSRASSRIAGSSPSPSPS
jgi:superfamily II DNA/RNA helicase